MVGRGSTSAAQDSANIYLLTGAEDTKLVDLFKLPKGASTLERLTDNAWPEDRGGPLEVDREQAYFGVQWPSVTVAPLAGGEASQAAIEQAFAVGTTHLVYCNTGTDGVVSVNKATGDRKIIAAIDDSSPDDDGVGSYLQVYRDHAYYVRFSTRDARDGLRRAPLVPGEEQVLTPRGTVEDDGTGDAYTVSDRGLFWAQDGRLLRLVLEDYLDASPAQGAAGGPCFGDLACNEGLTCAGMLCE